MRKNRYKSISKYLAVVTLWILLSIHIPAGAQESRTDEIIQKQAEKAKNLKPYVPNKAESLMIRTNGLGLIAPATGFYPFIGSAYSGGGFAAGVGYRYLYGDNSRLEVFGAWSVENYQRVQIQSFLPELLDGKLSTWFKIYYLNARHADFYGLGDSNRSDRSTYAYRPFSVSLEPAFRSKWLVLGAGIEYLHNDTGPGNSSDFPPVEDKFTPETAPGLGEDPDYIVGSLSFAIDWRQGPSYTTRGGLYRVEYFHYDQQNSGNLSFDRWNLEFDQFIPLYRANQILAFRAGFAFTDTDGDNEVPFYLMPRLGGSKELRGYPSLRFRDRNKMLLTAEYRWTPSKFMDMALFYEVGKVTPTRDELNFDNLRSSYGIATRFHTPINTLLRFELAFSKEHTRLIISAGTPF